MVKIIIDKRERNNVVKLLENSGLDLEFESLQVGDFILSNDVCVERKTIKDFVSSLIDKRLFNQATDLKNNFQKPLFILEGNFEDIFEMCNINPNAIRAAISSLLLDYQIPIIFANSEEETVAFLKTIAKREQEERKKEISIRGCKKVYTTKEMQQYLI